jgi:hypothetical protein
VIQTVPAGPRIRCPASKGRPSRWPRTIEASLAGGRRASSMLRWVGRVHGEILRGAIQQRPRRQGAVSQFEPTGSDGKKSSASLTPSNRQTRTLWLTDPRGPGREPSASNRRTSPRGAPQRFVCGPIDRVDSFALTEGGGATSGHGDCGAQGRGWRPCSFPLIRPRAGDFGGSACFGGEDQCQEMQ